MYAKILSYQEFLLIASLSSKSITVNVLTVKSGSKITTELLFIISQSTEMLSATVLMIFSSFKPIFVIKNASRALVQASHRFD